MSWKGCKKDSALIMSSLGRLYHRQRNTVWQEKDKQKEQSDIKQSMTKHELLCILLQVRSHQGVQDSVFYLKTSSSDLLMPLAPYIYIHMSTSTSGNSLLDGISSTSTSICLPTPPSIPMLACLHYSPPDLFYSPYQYFLWTPGIFGVALLKARKIHIIAFSTVQSKLNLILIFTFESEAQTILLKPRCIWYTLHDLVN